MLVEGITVIGGLVLILSPFCYAIFILKKLDAAATQRKQAGGETRFRFLIVDFLSLILLLQVPFNFVTLDLPDEMKVFLIAICLIALLLVWFTTIKTVSQAGISTFGWRALISMILIPTMYIGSFYFGFGCLSLIFGDASSRGIVWLVACVTGMILSPWIVSGALSSVTEPAPIDPESTAPDPFAD